MKMDSTADATALADLVRKGEVKPLELVEAAIARAKQLNPAINAIILPLYERAREQAAQTLPEGPLRGVPTTIKDLRSPAAGEPRHDGNRILKQLDFHDDHDCFVAAKLRAAGLVNIGRTNVPEFACGRSPITCENDAHGSTRNPWNLEHTAMGSSGGAAASVAAGIVPIAHGTDGGGSIRMPASACGVVGLKPTRGRISNGPDHGESWAGCSTHGMLTRSVRDAALALDILAGPMPGDPYYAPPPPRPFAEEVGAAPGTLRIGLLPSLPSLEVHRDCSEGVERVGRLLEALGHQVELSHPEAYEALEWLGDFATMVGVCTAATLDGWSQRIGHAWSEADLEPPTWEAAEQGRATSGLEYAAAIARLHAYARRLATWWEDGFDVLVTPTLATPPPRLGYLIDPEAGRIRLLQTMPFTAQFNVSGQPAISLPLHWSSERLPIGIQFVARYAGEGVLLRLAAQLEEATPWHDRHPEVCAAG
ncbi:MAG: amidase [Deltaproteobacteria bacterium]|nr:amidase [Deltaproteobacteria bacterium]